MRKFRNIVMMFALILAVSLGISCGGDGPKNPGNSTRTPVPSQNQTSSGVKIESAVALSDEQKSAIDGALTQLFTEARARNYNNKLNHSDYSIIIRNDCEMRGGIMQWKDRLDQYDGTEFDAEPAPGIGMVWQPEKVTLNPYKAPVFTICYDAPQAMGITTRYGAEHVILYYNDKSEFDRTQFHGNGGPPHPIIQ